MNNNEVTTKKKKRKYSFRAKGGFADNPQNINRKGPPTKPFSLTAKAREMLGAEPRLREQLLMAAFKQALDGDITALKLIWGYMDGMPIQAIEGTFDTRTEFVRKGTMKDIIKKYGKELEIADEVNE